MEFSEIVNDATIAFVEKQYHTACYKYKAALKWLSKSNISGYNSDQVIINYMLCKSWIELNTLQDILHALETLIQLKKYIGKSFPAIYYAMGKAYIKLYRFNSALDAINTGLAIANAAIHFQQFSIPMTHFSIEESTKEGLLSALMNLHDEASSWHCPDAKCYMEDCKNYVSHCLPCRDIFFRDPAFTGLVIVTCSNTNNPCKFKFHPVCWDYQKKKLCSVLRISDKEVIGHLCFTLDCNSNNSISIITKVEVFDKNQKVISAMQDSSPVTQPIPNSAVMGAIKKYPPQSFPKLRRPNLPHHSSPQKICSEEQPLKQEIEKEARLAKLIKLRETNFNTSHEKDWELDNDKYKNKNLDSSEGILSNLAFKNNDVETMQQCRFIFEILHEFIKSNVMVHINKLLLKWYETKEIMEYTKGIDEYLDTDIIELLLKSPKFIRIGNYICIPETLEQALQVFEQEKIQQCKSVLQDKIHEGNDDSQPTVDKTISHQNSVTDFENQTNQNSSKWSTNNSNENNNNIRQSPNMCETPINFSKTNSLNEEKTNILSQTKNMCDRNIEGDVQTSCIENKNKMDCNISQKDKSFIDPNDIKRNNKNFIDSMIHEDNSQSSITEDNFRKQLPNDDLHSKFLMLQEDYTQLMTNYSEMEQTLIKLIKEKADMEENFKLELEKKNSLIEAITEERKILIERLETYESQIAEDVPVKYKALNKGILTLQAEIGRLKQEKLDNEHNIQLLLKEKNVVKNTLEKNTTELSETIKHCEAKIDNKNTELITYQEKNLELKRCMLQKSLESQFFHNQNMLYQGIKHCQIAIDVFDNLNYITKQYFGFNVITNYTAWTQALNCLQAEYKKMEEDYLKIKSLLKSNTEVEKRDEVVMNSISLPPYPSRSLGTTVCDAFMIFYTNLKQIPQQNFSFVPPPVLLNPHMLQYVSYPVPPISPNKSILEKNKKKIIPVNSIESNINLTQAIPNHEKKNMEDKHQNISQKSDLGMDKTEGIQNTLQTTNNNKRVQESDLKDNEKNDFSDIIKKHVIDNNQVMAEIKTNEVSSTDVINSDVSNIFNENELVSKTNGISNNNDCKLLSESNIKEAMKEENIESAERGSNEILTNSTDKIMNILRNKYTGMSDFLLLKSLNDVRTMYGGTLTGVPLNAIIQNVEKYVLSHQIDHLCTYLETTETVTSTTTVLKESKKQSKNKVKKKTSNSIKLGPLKNSNLTNPSLVNQKNHKSATSTSTGAIKKEPNNLPKCPWDVIFKPGTNKNNYEESECVICMDNLHAIDKLIYILDCQHKFHKTCIKEWFQKNQSCPTCRIHCTIDEEYPPLP